MQLKKWREKINVEEIIRLNKDGKSLKRIAQEIGIPERRLGELVKLLQIPLKKGIRTRVNDSFFDEIDSEIKAYLLGYLIADGSIEEKSNRVLLGCNTQDLYLLKLFQNFICPDNKISERNKTVKLSFMSKNMIQTLRDKYKIMGRKTYDFEFDFPFEVIPSYLIPNFILGFIDGDGCFYFNKKYKRVLRISIVGTQLNFLTNLVTILKGNLKSSLYKYQKGNCFTLGLNVRKDEEKFLFNYLYSSSTFFLERKKSKFSNQYRGKLED